MPLSRFEYIFCLIYDNLHEILSLIENEDKVAVFFIEPPDICASDDESADKDGGGIIDKLNGSHSMH